MRRYIALLRGVNISGKNKLAMSELKLCVLKLGFSKVLTYLNSGNLVFSCDLESEAQIASKIGTMLQEQFGMDIPVLVISQDRLKTVLSSAPDWWGTTDPAVYDNLIFVFPGVTAEQVAERIGAPTAGLEQISTVESEIFWSFDRQKYAKANWWKKTASKGIGELLTIRTANTLRKIAAM